MAALGRLCSRINISRRHCRHTTSVSRTRGLAPACRHPERPQALSADLSPTRVRCVRRSPFSVASAPRGARAAALSVLEEASQSAAVAQLPHQVQQLRAPPAPQQLLQLPQRWRHLQCLRQGRLRRQSQQGGGGVLRLHCRSNRGWLAHRKGECRLARCSRRPPRLQPVLRAQPVAHAVASPRFAWLGTHPPASAISRKLHRRHRRRQRFRPHLNHGLTALAIPAAWVAAASVAQGIQTGAAWRAAVEHVMAAARSAHSSSSSSGRGRNFPKKGASWSRCRQRCHTGGCPTLLVGARPAARLHPPCDEQVAARPK